MANLFSVVAQVALLSLHGVEHVIGEPFAIYGFLLALTAVGLAYLSAVLLLGPKGRNRPILNVMSTVLCVISAGLLLA